MCARIAALSMLALVLTGCAPDKNAHAVAGAGASGLMTHATGDWKKGCVAALALGVAKEGYDAMGHGVVEAADVLATAAGCLVWTIEF